MKSRCICVVLLCGLSISSGCAAVRCTTNLKTPDNAATLSTRYKFRLEKVQYSVTRDSANCITAPYVPADIITGDIVSNRFSIVTIWDEAKWLGELKKTGESRYPAIFTTDQRSYPLSVSIKAVAHNSGQFMLVLFTFLTGFDSLPNPMWETCDFEVSTSISLDGGMTQAPLATVQFQRKDLMWVSLLTPLGLIPVPGRADKRQSGTMVGYLANPTAPIGYALSVESCVDAIVLSLQSSAEDIRKAVDGRSPGTGVGIVAP